MAVPMRTGNFKHGSSARTILRGFYILLLLAAFITGINPPDIEAASSRIDVLRIEGTIVPVVADYVERGIKQAEENDSTVCIIELVTPANGHAQINLFVS